MNKNAINATTAANLLFLKTAVRPKNPNKKTGEYIKTIYNHGGGPVWARLPGEERFIYSLNVSGGNIRKTDVTTDAEVSLMQTGCSQLSLMGGEGSISKDGRYMGLYCMNSGAFSSYGSPTNVDVIVVDILKKEVFSRFHINGQIDGGTISHNGEYLVVSAMDSDNPAGKKTILVYSISGQFLRGLQMIYGGGHWDTAVDADGNQVIVGGDANTSSLNMYNLNTGEKKMVAPEAYNRYRYHISGRNFDRPGWVYVSTYDSDGDDVGGAVYRAYLHREQFALKLDGSGTVERFAQLHGNYGQYRYDQQPNGVPNNLGTRLYFTDTFGTTSDTSHVVVSFAKE